MTEKQGPPRYYRHRETGTVCRVIKTDDSYAYIEVLRPTQSRHAITRAEYDRTWLDSWAPADSQPDDPDAVGFELPANFAEKIGPSIMDPPVRDDDETT